MHVIHACILPIVGSKLLIWCSPWHYFYLCTSISRVFIQVAGNFLKSWKYKAVAWVCSCTLCSWIMKNALWGCPGYLIDYQHLYQHLDHCCNNTAISLATDYRHMYVCVIVTYKLLIVTYKFCPLALAIHNYCIAGNFLGRKLLRIGRKGAFHGENLYGMLNWSHRWEWHA